MKIRDRFERGCDRLGAARSGHGRTGYKKMRLMGLHWLSTARVGGFSTVARGLVRPVSHAAIAGANTVLPAQHVRFSSSFRVPQRAGLSPVLYHLEAGCDMGRRARRS